MTAVEAGRDLVLVPASVESRRTLGALAWVALEALAFRARLHDGSWVVDVNVRMLADELVVGKNRSAKALHCLVEAGLVQHRPCRMAGRFSSSAYILEEDACRRAGLHIGGGPGSPALPPCPQKPCPDSPDTAPGDAESGQIPSPPRVPPPPETTAHTQQPSLFDPSPASPDHDLHTHDRHSEDRLTQHRDPSPDPSPLTTPNRSDALAPGVLPPAFSLGWELNGNLTEGFPPC